MLAAALYGPGEVRIEEQPVPQPGPGEIVVRVEAALTCATDLKIFRNGRHPTLGPLPARIGHEMAGLVAKTGPGQTRFREGERVMVANSAPCDDCRACWRGQPSQCRNLMFLHGGFAQHLLVPRRIADLNVRPIPANLPYEHAALAEPLACALRGIEAAQIRPGATVVVIGGGALGLLLSRLAKRAGAQVILVGRRGDRLSLARNAYGIDETVDATLPDPAARVEALTDGEGGDVVIEAVGTPEAWESAVEMTRNGGTVVFFGGCPPGKEMRMDTHRLHYNELTLRGVFHHSPRHIHEALTLLAEGAVDPEPLLSGHVPLRDLPEALRLMETRQGLKYVVHPWPS